MSADEAAIPLCIDLDGTLTPVDTLHEQLLALARRSPRALIAALWALWRGKAAFKRALGERQRLDAGSLPYHGALLDWLREQHGRGRRLVLATASDLGTARAVADHLGLFDEIFASDGGANLAGEHKRRALVDRFGERGYDYAGNDRVDEAVWRSARQAIVVGPPALAARAAALAAPGPVFAAPAAGLSQWLRAARLYQWVKNLLVFVPAVLAHGITGPAELQSLLLAFLAFGLCASSVYLVNDLLDLGADRRHPRKRFRPFAAGTLSARGGVLGAGLLLLAAALAAAQINPLFCAVLALYYGVTCAYSLALKRKAIVDVMTLAGLYTLRIIAGAAAAMILPSFWLLAFSMFLFLSLGIVKRYTELDDAPEGQAPAGRGYGRRDLPLLQSLGTASGYSAIVVLALYVNSADAQALYRHSQGLWLICPLLLFWISRIWLLTVRGQMHDDPILFTLRDRSSLAVIALSGLIVAGSV